MNGMTMVNTFPLSISKLREGYALSKCFSYTTLCFTTVPLT